MFGGRTSERVPCGGTKLCTKANMQLSVAVHNQYNCDQAMYEEKKPLTAKKCSNMHGLYNKTAMFLDNRSYLCKFCVEVVVCNEVTQYRQGRHGNWGDGTGAESFRMYFLLTFQFHSSLPKPRSVRYLLNMLIDRKERKDSDIDFRPS